MPREVCQNCGETIGNLEAAYVFRDQAVCGRCYRRLAGARSKAWLYVVVASVCGVLIGVVMWWGPWRQGTSRSFGTIAGAAWLTREDGSSDLQRGLEVFVGRGPIPRQGIVRCLQEEIARLENLENLEQDVGRQRRIAEIRRVIETVPAEMDAVKAYKVCASWMGEDLPPNLTPALTANMIMREITDAEGKYSFAQVPEGDYYLVAIKGTKTFLVEWVLPIRVSGAKTTKLDLFNGNAAFLRNVHR